MNNEILIKEPLKVSASAKRLFAKLEIYTLEDACNTSLDKLKKLVAGNNKYQVFVDELWEYVHKNGLKFKDEEEYYQKMAKMDRDCTIDKFFMSRNARRFLSNYNDIPSFLRDLQKTTFLKRFLCLIITYEVDNSLEEIFKNYGNIGLILNMIIADFKHDLKTKGKLIPIFTIIDESNIYNALIRNGYWLVSDLLALRETDILKVPRLGPNKAKKILEVLKDNGFVLEQSSNDIVLNLTYISMDKLGLDTKLVKKLYDLGITNLDELLNISGFTNFTDEELKKIRESILKLGIVSKDRMLGMSNYALIRNYNKNLVEKYRLEEELRVIDNRNLQFKRVLTADEAILQKLKKERGK